MKFEDAVSSRPTEHCDRDLAMAYFQPKPSPFRMIRVGGRSDGAYLVPDDLEGVDACFSPGVANRKDFEDELFRTRRIRSYMVDFSADETSFHTPLEPGEQFFDKKWLGPDESETTISLATWVGEREPQSSSLLLQMDIEGAEYANLATVPDSVIRQFRILVIEFHDFRSKLMGLPDDTEFAKVVEKLSKSFRVVHARANNCCGSRPFPFGTTGVPWVIELTFLRNDRFDSGLSDHLRSPKIPHPKDISRNLPHNAPLHLGGDWVGGKRPLVSKIKMVADYVCWVLYAAFVPNPTKPSERVWRFLRSVRRKFSLLPSNGRSDREPRTLAPR